jgi:hypothetical protein
MKPLATTAKGRMDPLFWWNETTYHHGKEQGGSNVLVERIHLPSQQRIQWFLYSGGMNPVITTPKRKVVIKFYYNTVTDGSSNILEE